MDISFPSWYRNEKTKVASLADWLRLAQLVSGAGSLQAFLFCICA